MERFFWFLLKKRHILTKFELSKKFSALDQNQRDTRDYSASGRGCVMRDCQIERNTTVYAFLHLNSRSLAKVPSVFVGGAPLICAPRHCYIILLLW